MKVLFKTILSMAKENSLTTKGFISGHLKMESNMVMDNIVGRMDLYIAATSKKGNVKVKENIIIQKMVALPEGSGKEVC